MLTVIVPGVCASEAFSYSGEDALGIASSDEQIEEMSQPELSKAIFSIDGATTDVKTGITSDSKDTDELEKQYGVLNIPSTVLTYDAVSFKTVNLNKEGENSLKVRIYGKEYELMLELITIGKSYEGINSYEGYIQEMNNSNVLFTFDESMNKSIVYCFIQLENEQLYVLPVQTRENGLKTDNPLHIIYSSNDVASPTEEQRINIEKRADNYSTGQLKLPETGYFSGVTSLKPQNSPSSLAFVDVLVAVDNEFYENETNWISSAVNLMVATATQFRRSDIGVYLTVQDYDYSKKDILSGSPRENSDPLNLFVDTFSPEYLNSKNADIAVYLGGNDITSGNDATAQGMAFGYGFYGNVTYHNICRYAWCQMVEDTEPAWGPIYDGSEHARTYCVTHELGHIFNANHEDSEGTNRAYFWFELLSPMKRTVMWSGYFGPFSSTSEFSSSNSGYHGDNTHDNAGAIRAVKHNIAALV